MDNVGYNILESVAKPSPKEVPTGQERLQGDTNRTPASGGRGTGPRPVRRSSALGGGGAGRAGGWGGGEACNRGSLR